MTVGRVAGFSASLALALLMARAASGQTGGEAEQSKKAPAFSSLASALQPADQELWQKRLANSVPRYELQVAVAEDLQQVSVRQVLTYTNVSVAKAPDQSLWLRVFANEGSRVLVKMGAIACRPIACETVSDGKSLIVLRLARPLPVGEALTVEASFSTRLEQLAAERTTTMGQLGDSMAALSGQGSGDYGLLAMGDGIASLAHFYLEVARKRNGQWVGPESSAIGDKGTDELRHIHARVELPTGVSLVATGEERRVSATTFEVLAPAVRDFTLLMSRDFVRLEQPMGQVLVSSTGLARDREALREVLDTAAHALSVFEAEFGPYPYTQLDLVQAPVIGGAGGVEFSGLATVASALYNDSDPMGQLATMLGGDQMPSRKRVREMVVAHEVAHQYWHGLVAPIRGGRSRCSMRRSHSTAPSVFRAALRKRVPSGRRTRRWP